RFRRPVTAPLLKNNRDKAEQTVALTTYDTFSLYDRHARAHNGDIQNSGQRLSETPWPRPRDPHRTGPKTSGSPRPAFPISGSHIEQPFATPTPPGRPRGRALAVCTGPDFRFQKKRKRKIRRKEKENLSGKIFPLASRAQLQTTKPLHNKHHRKLSRCSHLSAQPASQNTSQIVNGNSPTPASRPKIAGRMNSIGFIANMM